MIHDSLTGFIILWPWNADSSF